MSHRGHYKYVIGYDIVSLIGWLARYQLQHGFPAKAPGKSRCLCFICEGSKKLTARLDTWRLQVSSREVKCSLRMFFAQMPNPLKAQTAMIQMKPVQKSLQVAASECDIPHSANKQINQSACTSCSLTCRSCTSLVRLVRVL